MIYLIMTFSIQLKRKLMGENKLGQCGDNGNATEGKFLSFSKL